MNNILKQFYDNEVTREAVKVFMIETLKEMAVERTFAGKDVKGIQEARELVDKMFYKLDEICGVKKTSIATNSR